MQETQETRDRSLGWEDPWKWQPTSVCLPGKFHGQRNLVGYSPWGLKELDVTEWLSTSTPFLTVSTSLFPVSASLLLPCKQVHQYHLSRFHIYALIYHICFSLSNFLIAFSPLYFWDLHSALILLIGLQTLWGHVSYFLSLILCWSYSVSGT